SGSCEGPSRSMGSPRTWPRLPCGPPPPGRNRAAGWRRSPRRARRQRWRQGRLSWKGRYLAGRGSRHGKSTKVTHRQSRRLEVRMPGSVIVAGARTPIGKLSGALASFSAMDLGGLAIKAALERAGVRPDQVDYVFMGQVLLAGQGQITARQAAVKAGIPM